MQTWWVPRAKSKRDLECVDPPAAEPPHPGAETDAAQPALPSAGDASTTVVVREDSQVDLGVSPVPSTPESSPRAALDEYLALTLGGSPMKTSTPGSIWATASEIERNDRAQSEKDVDEQLAELEFPGYIV